MAEKIDLHEQLALWAKDGLLGEIESTKWAVGSTGNPTDILYASQFNRVINTLCQEINVCITKINNILQVCATPYNDKYSYDIGALCVYENSIYRCKKKHNSSNPQTPATAEFWEKYFDATYITEQLALKANIDSQALTGKPTTPTPALSTKKEVISVENMPQIANAEFVARYVAEVTRGVSELDLSAQSKDKAYPVVLSKDGEYTNTRIYREKDDSGASMLLTIKGIASNNGTTTPEIKVQNVAYDGYDTEDRRFVKKVLWEEDSPLIIAYIRGGYKYMIMQRDADSKATLVTGIQSFGGKEVRVEDWVESEALESIVWESSYHKAKVIDNNTLSLVNWDFEFTKNYIAGEAVLPPYKLMEYRLPNGEGNKQDWSNENRRQIQYLKDAVGMSEEQKWEWIGAYPCVTEIIDGQIVEIEKLNPKDLRFTIEGNSSTIETLGKDVMMRFRRLGYRLVEDGDYIRVLITDEPNHPKFYYFPFQRDGLDKDRVYVGVYLTYAYQSKSYSISGKSASGGNFATHRTWAWNRGITNDYIYFQQTWIINRFLAMLGYLCCDDLVCWKKIGKGVRINSNIASGQTNQFGSLNELASESQKTDGKNMIKYLGIEALYGSYEYQWVDGLLNDSGILIYYNNNITQMSNDKKTGFKVLGGYYNNGYGSISRITADNECPFFPYKYTSSNEGLGFGYYGAVGRQQNGEYCTVVGGHYSVNSGFLVYDDSPDSLDYHLSRLCLI